MIKPSDLTADALSKMLLGVPDAEAVVMAECPCGGECGLILMVMLDRNDAPIVAAAHKAENWIPILNGMLEACLLAVKPEGRAN